MSIVDSIRSKVSEANEALAGAKKSWQSDSLSRREKELAEHERRLAQRKAELDVLLQELKALERNRFKQALRYGLIALGAAIPSYIVGVNSAQFVEHSRTSAPAPLPAQKPQQVTAPLPFHADTDEQQHPPSDQPSTVTTSSGFTLPPGPIASCAKRGVAYFIEIGSYPTLHSDPDAGRTAEDVAVERCTRTTTAFQ